jgi:hypothetical protein
MLGATCCVSVVELFIVQKVFTPGLADPEASDATRDVLKSRPAGPFTVIGMVMDALVKLRGELPSLNTRILEQLAKLRVISTFSRVPSVVSKLGRIKLLANCEHPSEAVVVKLSVCVLADAAPVNRSKAAVQRMAVWNIE